MTNNFKVIWVFKNDHEWHKTFDTQDECYDFINRVGLVSHPDIIRVTVSNSDSERDLKRVV